MTAQSGRRNHTSRCFGTSLLRNRVVATVRERVAAEHSPDCHQAAAHHAIAVYGFYRVLRASREIAARGRKHGRDCPLVSAKQVHHEGFGRPVHRLSTDFSITSNARLISFRNSAKLAVRTDFLGLITTST